MEITIGDLLTIEGKKYITLETLMYEGQKYAFVNEVTEEEECTQDYYIFKLEEEGIKIIIEENLKNILIPRFEQLLKKDINELLNEQ